MTSSDTVSILMVCMGNICRSPTAEGVLRQRARARNLDHRLVIDSAGTHSYHIGAAPDRRSIEYAQKRGYDLTTLRARHLHASDFERFDLLLAMDHDNLRLIQERCPPEHQHKVGLFMRYAQKYDSPIVPDPYYGEQRDFELVLDYCEDASDGLLATLHAAPID